MGSPTRHMTRQQPVQLRHEPSPVTARARLLTPLRLLKLPPLRVGEPGVSKLSSVCCSPMEGTSGRPQP